MPEDVDDSSGATVANADPGLWRAAVLPFEQGVDARTIMETRGRQIRPAAEIAHRNLSIS